MSETAENWRQVRVSFRKQVSDGNFGTEAVEVTFEDYIHPMSESDVDDAIADELLIQARNVVNRQLLRSPSMRVRQSLDAPKQDARHAAVLPPDDEPSF